MYVWQDGNPVQLAGNLSLPGGFQLGAFGSEYCDVVTATGETRDRGHHALVRPGSSLAVGEMYKQYIFCLAPSASLTVESDQNADPSLPSLPVNQVRRRRKSWLKVKIVLASED